MRHHGAHCSHSTFQRRRWQRADYPALQSGKSLWLNSVCRWLQYKGTVGLLASLVALPGCSLNPRQHSATAIFEDFQYVGRDTIFEEPLRADEFQNPILAGFYPDPSITRANDQYYLTVSSFAYFPGAPLFKSSDLVHWEQVGHILDRTSQFNLKNLSMSHGMYAPTLRFHQGTFYMITTSVYAGGNFLVTAQDPDGPWSDPIWLPEVGGIDPDIFFDDDGRIYISHNDAPPGEPLYEGHRAIWMWEYDPEQQSVIKESRQLLVNGGTDIKKEPIWIEAPHIFKKDGWYYLSCAEGGTGYNHSQVVFRSRSLNEPFEPYRNNPILTQRDLDINRADPITTAGHADIVQTQNGEWWAVFLATRAYDKTAYNTGRETFLLPVHWENGWPHILPSTEAIPYRLSKPQLPQAPKDIAPTTGNFTWQDSFDNPQLDMRWVTQRSPDGQWWHIQDGALHLSARDATLSSNEQPAFIARRQQHTKYSASTQLQLPKHTDYSAGLSVFQNEQHHYYLAVEKHKQGYRAFLEQAKGEHISIIREHIFSTNDSNTIRLGVEQDAGEITFYLEPKDNVRVTLAENIDGKMLSTEVAGGFLGATIGLHTRTETNKVNR